MVDPDIDSGYYREFEMRQDARRSKAMGKVKLTERQMDHLEILRDGELHWVRKGQSSRACFEVLVTKGFAEKVSEPWTYHKSKYRITPAGCALLASSGKTGE